MILYFAIVFLLGVLCGAGLAYHFAGVAALREKLARLERGLPPPGDDAGA